MNQLLSFKYLPFLLLVLFVTGIFTVAFKYPASRNTDLATPAIDTEQNRFTKVVLAQKLEEPMQFEILKDGRVLFAERKGKLKLYSPATGKVTVDGRYTGKYKIQEF